MKGLVIFRRHILSAVHCLERHAPGKPFHFTLQNFFKSNRGFGSRDRRRIKAMCYAWFRLGYSLKLSEKGEQVAWAHMVLNNEQGDWTAALLEAYDLPVTWFDTSLAERIKVLEDRFEFSYQDLFPSPDQTSPMLDPDHFLESQLEQPLLWFRLTGKSGGGHTQIETIRTEEGAIGVQIGTKLEEVPEWKNNIEIQDLSSQKIMHELLKEPFGMLWDCCAASGGKSLYLLDNQPNVQIMASDVRSNILSNLTTRTGRHQNRVWAAEIDMSDHFDTLTFRNRSGEKTIGKEEFDVILADVPCSGSGTWSRNPEFKYCFSFEQKIEQYNSLQRAIVRNVWPFLKPGGLLLYSTCSVYRIENEDVVDEFSKEVACDIAQMGYIEGYNLKSDTMFHAWIRKK